MQCEKQKFKHCPQLFVGFIKCCNLIQYLNPNNLAMKGMFPTVNWQRHIVITIYRHTLKIHFQVWSKILIWNYVKALFLAFHSLWDFWFETLNNTLLTFYSCSNISRSPRCGQTDNSFRPDKSRQVNIFSPIWQQKNDYSLSFK